MRICVGCQRSVQHSCLRDTPEPSIRLCVVGTTTASWKLLPSDYTQILLDLSSGRRTTCSDLYRLATTLKSLKKYHIPAAALTCKNLVSGMRKLIFRWHSLQIDRIESPRTPTTPGAGYDVEHSEHVGMKLL